MKKFIANFQWYLIHFLTIILCEKFNVEYVYNALVKWIREWFENNGEDCVAVLGMSGGKDSTVMAKLLVDALGKERVVGVAMPDEGQGLNDADKICEYLGIKFIISPIGDECKATRDALIKNGINPSVQTIQNIPPRVRNNRLRAIAQSLNGRTINTCNWSEDIIGYFTIDGDGSGDVAPMGNLTVTEILAIGDYVKLPYEWVHKTPDDGLPHSTSDEIKLGFTYAVLDKYIRHIELPNEEIREKIDTRIKNNSFKLRPRAKY